MVRDTTVGDDRPEGAVEPTDGTEDGAFLRWQTDTERALADAETARVDVYVRSLLPPPGAKEGQTDAIGKLRDLVEESVLDDVTVNVWGERICLCEECRELDTGRMLLDTVLELQRWGEEYDATTRSNFERHSSSSYVTGQGYEGIVPPRVTCALYVDGALSGVFPCQFPGRPVSVRDFHEALSSGERREASADRREPVRGLQGPPVE